MDFREMKATAAQRLAEARDEKKIALIFGGITVDAEARASRGYIEDATYAYVSSSPWKKSPEA